MLEAKKKQLEDAISYCKLEKAMNTGICPLIKSRIAIDRRLDIQKEKRLGDERIHPYLHLKKRKV